MRDENLSSIVGVPFVSQAVHPVYGTSVSQRLYAEEPLRPLNPDYHSVLRKRLRQNPRALQYLHAEGFDHETISYFGLGLSTPYVKRKNEQEQADALVYPVILRDGRFGNKYGYYNIPGVTKNPAARSGWMSGDARTYYALVRDGPKRVFVCQDVKDLWHL